MLARNGKHSAGSSGRIIHGANHPRPGQHRIILYKQQVDHQADNFAGGKMLSGGLVGQLGKLADQLFKHQPHLAVVNRFRMQIYLGKLFGNDIQQAAFCKAIHLGLKIETFKYIPYCR